jgi:PST family polysaccharide transporter
VVPLLFWFVGRTGPVGTWDIYKALVPGACASAATVGAVMAFRWQFSVSHPLLGVVETFLLASGISFLSLLILPSGRVALRDLRIFRGHLSTS